MARTIQVGDERYNGLVVQAMNEARSTAGLVEWWAKQAGNKTYTDAETIAIFKKNGWKLPEYLKKVEAARSQ